MPAWTRAALALFVVGFGANQFAAMLPVYRMEDGATTAQVNALFGAYALGLIPALLVMGPLSDRLGRRRVIRPVLVLSFAATIVLMAGGEHLGVLLVGRLLAGLASGAAFAPGTAWVKELSTGPAGTGARRAAIALSAGFGTGPLVTGVVAQWGPHPTLLPYVPHLVLTVAIGAIAWSTHEPARATTGDVETEAGRIGRTLRSRTFLLRVLPTAPWVFGCASFAFTTVPQIQSVPGPDVAVVGAIVALTLWTGVAVQPLGRRWAPTTTILLGLASGCAGFLVAVLAARLDSGALVPVAAMLLGAAYGWVLVGGLTTVEEITAPADLASVNAVFYSLTYLGFAAPYLGTLLLEHLSGTTTLLLLAALVALSSVPASLSRRS